MRASKGKRPIPLSPLFIETLETCNLALAQHICTTVFVRDCSSNSRDLCAINVLFDKAMASAHPSVRGQVEGFLSNSKEGEAKGAAAELMVLLGSA